MDFTWAMGQMRAGAWVTQSSHADPTYRMTMCEDKERFDEVISEVRADGNEAIAMRWDGSVCVERTGQANVCVSKDVRLAAVYADDWELWKPKLKRRANHEPSRR